MPPVPRTPLNIRADNPTAVARAAEQLRERILTGELPEGKRLSEVELAAELAVSRQTVHLALAQLQGTGLAERREGGGLRVTVPDARYIAEVSTVALLLWKPALLETDFLADPSTVDAVLAALTQVRSMIADGQPKDGAAFTSAFFDVFRPIVALTGNRVWLELHDLLATRGAIGVRGFTEAIDAAGISAWTAAIEKAVRAGDRRALYEVFASLSALSTTFQEDVEGVAPSR